MKNNKDLLDCFETLSHLIIIRNELDEKRFFMTYIHYLKIFNEKEICMSLFNNNIKKIPKFNLISHIATTNYYNTNFFDICISLFYKKCSIYIFKKIIFNMIIKIFLNFTLDNKNKTLFKTFFYSKNIKYYNNIMFKCTIYTFRLINKNFKFINILSNLNETTFRNYKNLIIDKNNNV